MSPISLRSRRLRRTLLTSLLTLPVAALVAGCGGDDGEAKSGTKGASKDALVVYSGREKDLVDPLYKEFEQKSGIDLDIRYADSAELAATLQEEGENSPADVFFAQDAGSVGSVESLLAPLSQAQLNAVPKTYRDSDARWVGVTGRIRVLVYNTDELEEGDLPASVFDMVDSEWKGRVGVAPTNASFVGFVSGMRLAVGDERTEQWLADLAANDPKIYEKNGQIVDAVGAGEVETGLVNHYYLYERLEGDPDLPIANHFFDAGDPGTLVNVSAIGLLATSKRSEEAAQLIDFLLDEGQRFIANDAPEREYPLVEVEGLERAKELPALAEVAGPQVDLSDLGGKLESTVEMIAESGLGE